MKHILLLLSISLLTLFACQKGVITREPSSYQKEYVAGQKFDKDYNPDVSSSKFTNSTIITNPYYPVEAGKKYIYEGQTSEGFEHVEEQRLNTTKIILGITCIAVNFKAYINGNLIEDTEDWYAQDNDGNLWYFGEAVNNYNIDGSLADHSGSWEAGLHNAKPGIIMLANPQPDAVYREEYYFKHAEDEAEVLETGLKIKTPFGHFNNCINTKNWTRLEPDVIEHKIYAPGYGLIKETDLSDGSEILLMDIQ